MKLSDLKDHIDGLKFTVTQEDVERHTNEYNNVEGYQDKSGYSSRANVDSEYVEEHLAKTFPDDLEKITALAREKIAKDLGVSVEDLNVTSLFLQAQDKWIDSEISSVVNSLAAGSVLIDYMGTTVDNTPYTSTLDESKIFNLKELNLTEND